MAGIKEHEYLKLCAELASVLSISIAAASKKIDVAAARQGVRDISARKDIARALLSKAKELASKGDTSMSNQLDALLEALAEEENFLIED